MGVAHRYGPGVPDIHYPTPAGELPGYLAEPAVGPGAYPGVIVIMDALGLSDDIRLQADRLAAAGYLALAPDLYGRGGMLKCVTATLRASRSGHGPAYDDIDAARRYLTERPDCTGAIGIIGFCMGGGFALLSAVQLPFAASSVNYGFVPDDIEDRLATGACPIVGSYGERDLILRGHPQRLEAACVRAGVPHDIKEYAGVGHSFLNRLNVGPLSPLLRITGFGYNHAVAEDAWRRILVFLDEHLRQASGD
jgi:carboxymethylenebutenolidase